VRILIVRQCSGAMIRPCPFEVDPIIGQSRFSWLRTAPDTPGAEDDRDISAVSWLIALMAPAMSSSAAQKPRSGSPCDNPDEIERRTRGIGRAYCERLAADGANVVVIDKINATESLSSFQSAGQKLAIVCDVGEPWQVEGAAGKVLDRFGRCDIFVNNAAYMPMTTLETVRSQVWGHVQAATNSLANELGDNGITVNSLAPTVVLTEGSADRLPQGRPSPEEMMDRIISQQTIKRTCVPNDVANALCFLVSDGAGFITGQIIHVDGGRTRSGA
jgi:NAD(P)-dependent dehydrogenase (short-subunit alcohol dehydrogenase family)